VIVTESALGLGAVVTDGVLAVASCGAVAAGADCPLREGVSAAGGLAVAAAHEAAIVAKNTHEVTRLKPLITLPPLPRAA